MAKKIYLDKLKNKYEHIPVKGKVYEELMTNILSVQSQKISNAVGRIEKSNWDKINTTAKGILKIPDISDVLPQKSIFLRKAATKGKIITDTLRDRLTNDLRSTLLENKFNENLFNKRGTKTGVINSDVIKQFKSKITNTFDNYTKKENGQMPANIETIARTEILSAVNEIKYNYGKKVEQNNPNVKLEKEWVHKNRIGKIPREGHKMMNGKTIPYSENFILPIVNKEKGFLVYKGNISCKHPHDPALPASEIIACECNLRIKVKQK